MLGACLYAPGVIKTDKVYPGDEVLIVDEYGNRVAAGIARMSSKEILQKKQGLAVEVTQSKYHALSLRETPLYQSGYFYSQSLPAILTSRILNPKPNEFIIDMCAAPGGKTTHVAQLMNNKGTILAVDRSPSRLQKLEHHVQRLGITNVKILRQNALRLAEEYSLKADRILIDPPCSALGHRPKLYETKTKNEILACAAYQRQFLGVAGKLIKKGGIIAYSTCTLSVEENELNIKHAVEHFGFSVLDQTYFYGSPGELREEFPQAKHLQRFYPDLHDTPGFFVALMKKI
ncbi:MAG: PUA domain-containing protein [Promethearchaeota archaeon]